MKTSFARLLTMNEAVCRSHQSVPQTNVPAKVRNNQIDILFFPLCDKSKKKSLKRKSILADAHLEAFVSFVSASPLPVVSREPRGSDEGGRANKDKVVSRLVVALQRLPAKKKRASKQTKTQRSAAVTVMEPRDKSATPSPGRVWECSRWCWSAKDSSLRQHPRYQTAQNQPDSEVLDQAWASYGWGPYAAR